VAQGRNHREHEKSNQEKEDGVSDEMIVGIVEDLAERHTKRGPNGG
jgi:hypothetical protein